MSVSARRTIGALLILVVSAMALPVVVRLFNLACLEGRTPYWIFAGGVASAFALYFLIGVWSIVRRAYLSLGIATLWAWQLLTLSPILVPGCANDIWWARLDQSLVMSFWGFVAGMIVLGAATSIVIFRLYRRVWDSPPDARRKSLGTVLLGATILLAILVGGAFGLVPLFRDVFTSFGADLPAPTLLLLQTYGYLALIPMLCAATYYYFSRRAEHTDRQMNLGIHVASGWLVLANVLLSGLVFALYLPTQKMCACV